MKNLHFGHCIVGVVLAGIVLVALGVSASTLGIFAVALACPLMMVVMMRTMMGSGRSDPRDRDDRPADHQQPR
jgi:hypothetical protein